MDAGHAIVAFPLLLGSAYALYRVGHRGPRVAWLDSGRLVAEALVLVVVCVVSVRFVGLGWLEGALGAWSAAVGIAGVVGLLGLDALRIQQAARGLDARGAES